MIAFYYSCFIFMIISNSKRNRINSQFWLFIRRFSLHQPTCEYSETVTEKIPPGVKRENSQFEEFLLLWLITKEHWAEIIYKALPVFRGLPFQAAHMLTANTRLLLSTGCRSWMGRRCYAESMVKPAEKSVLHLRFSRASSCYSTSS